MVWLSASYISLEVLISAPKLLRQPEHINKSLEDKKALIDQKARFWYIGDYTLCALYYILRTYLITRDELDCRLSSDPLCTYSTIYYTYIVYSNIAMYILLTCMFFKSIFMIQRSIEDQRRSVNTLRDLIKVNKWQFYLFSAIAVIELAALIFSLFLKPN